MNELAIPQNVETDVSFKIDVGMINLSLTANLWRFMRVVGTYFEVEGEMAAFVETLKKKKVRK